MILNNIVSQETLLSIYCICMLFRKMKEMKRGCFLVTTLLLLLGCVPWHVTADLENGEEDQDIPGKSLQV